MAAEKTLKRVVFREPVDMPGDGVITARTTGGNEHRIVSDTESIVPTRGAIGGGKARYAIFWSEGFVIIEHPQSRIRVRVPASMVKSMVFLDDVPQAKAAVA